MSGPVEQSWQAERQHFTPPAHVVAFFDVPGWMEEGVCAQTDPEVFFPNKGESPKPAKAVCLVCPVREDCLNYALDRQERFGVWGGLSERERRKLERRRTCRWCEAKPVAADRKQYCGTDCADAARGDQLRRAAS